MHPFLKRLARAWKDPRFYWYSLLFILVGVGIAFLPAGLKQQVCTFYRGHVEPEVDKRLASVLGTMTSSATTAPSATTSPAATTQATEGDEMTVAAASRIRHVILDSLSEYFCPQHEAATLLDTLKRRELGLLTRRVLFVTPVSMLIAAILVSLMPRPEAAIRPNVAVAERAPHPAAGAVPRGLLRLQVPDYLVGTPGAEADLHMRSRQLRTAIRYAALSGALTVVAPPPFDPSATLFAVTVHLAVLAGMAFCIGFWSSGIFAKLQLSSWDISSRTAFAGVFVAGVIALSITLPYLVLNPTTSSVVDRDQILRMLLMRLILLPGIASLGGWVALSYFRARAT